MKGVHAKINVTRTVSAKDFEDLDNWMRNHINKGEITSIEVWVIPDGEE